VCVFVVVVYVVGGGVVVVMMIIMHFKHTLLLLVHFYSICLSSSLFLFLSLSLFFLLCVSYSFRDREERKGAMIEAALAYTKYAKVNMAPPHSSSAKYAHIISPNQKPAAASAPLVAPANKMASSTTNRGIWAKKSG
jgi:hypothetical protein